MENYMRNKNNPNFGHKWTKEQKLKQSLLTKKAMNKIAIRDKMIKNHSDVSGKNNPMFGVHRFAKEAPCYKDGRSLRQNYCIDCNNPIQWQSKRCKECADKNKKLPQKFCVDCGRKICRRATRCKSCALKYYYTINPKLIGKKSPNYIHGQGYAPYPIEFNNTLKLKIRNRDNFKCQNCNMIEEEHIIVIGQVLHVHHIDYNKQNCKEDNLITLCQHCNLRANYNRKYWQDYFIKKVKIYG